LLAEAFAAVAGMIRTRLEARTTSIRRMNRVIEDLQGCGPSVFDRELSVYKPIDVVSLNDASTY
jgi:hypothetical protein